jgi:hypothetical protein
MLAAALGIFLFAKPDAPPQVQRATIAEMASPAISGFTLDVNWSDIDHDGGSFNWSAVDLYAIPAIRAGLPLKVGLIAGGYTPVWVLAKVPHRTIQSSVLLGEFPLSYLCQSADEPAPWNATFKNAFLAAQAALAAHLASLHATVVAVELTGLNHTTSELNLESQSTQPRGSRCPFTDATRRWLSIGYRPNRAENAAAELYAGVQSAWPGVQPVLEYLANNAMPGISSDGQPESEADAELVFHAIIAGAPGVQWNGLSADDVNPIPAVWTQAVTAGAFGALQTPAYQPGDAGTPCAPARYSRVCSGALFGANLQHGISAGAKLIEVWSGDFMYEDQIAIANQRLRAQ